VIGPILGLLAFAGAMLWLTTVVPGAANAAVGAIICAGLLAIQELADWMVGR